MNFSYRLKIRRVFYFGVCICPLGFLLFMIAGALEDVSFSGYPLARLFVVFGTGLLLLVIALLVSAPLISLDLESGDSFLIKRYRVVGITILSKTFEGGRLEGRNERRTVFASETLASQNESWLVSVPRQGRERIVVGDLERIMFDIDILSLESHEQGERRHRI